VFYTLYGGYKSNFHEQYIALFHAIHILTGYGLGASLIALFGRVGDGIFTKAADVGADLVGKGTDLHKATVIGDTVGDPLKNTASPSMDILIKLMSIVSLMIAPILIKIEPLLRFLF